MLNAFITANRAEIIERCKAKVAARSPLPPDNPGIDHGVPLFLEELLDELKNGPTANQTINRSATQHGHDSPWSAMRPSVPMTSARSTGVSMMRLRVR